MSDKIARHTGRQADGRTDREACMQTDTDRQTDRQAGRQANRQAGMQRTGVVRTAHALQTGAKCER